jgi:hypothetical protein
MGIVKRVQLGKIGTGFKHVCRRNECENISDEDEALESEAMFKVDSFF